MLAFTLPQNKYIHIYLGPINKHKQIHTQQCTFYTYTQSIFKAVHFRLFDSFPSNDRWCGRTQKHQFFDSHLSTAWPLYEFNNSMHPRTHARTTRIHSHVSSWVNGGFCSPTFCVFDLPPNAQIRKLKERERAKVEWSYRKQTLAHYNLDSNINCRKAVIVMWKIRHLRNR